MFTSRMMPSSQVSQWVNNNEKQIILPSRGGPQFNANQYAGCIGWWDISSLAGYSDGAAVTSIPDLSGAGRTMAGTGPTFAALARNGLPALNMNNNNNSMGTTQTTGTEFTMIITGNLNAGNVNNIFYNGGSNGWGIYINGTLRIHYGAVVFITGPTPASGWTTLMMTGSSGTDYLYQNGSVIASGNSTPNSPNGTMYFSGAMTQVGEVIYYSRQLNSTERTEVTTALNRKWSIT
jgi:hypothetical protein